MQGPRLTKLTAGLATFLLLGATDIGDAKAWVSYRSAAGAVLHWETHALELFISNNLPDGWRTDDVTRTIEAAVAPWAGHDCNPLMFTVNAPDDATADPADEANSIVWLHDVEVWDAGFGSTELARTIITHRVNSGTIIDTDILFNVGGFDFDLGPVCDDVFYDLQATLTHEVGHVLGFDHETDDASVMGPTADPGDCQKRALDDADIAGFCTVYGPLKPAEPTPDDDPADAQLSDATPDALSDASNKTDTVTQYPPANADGCGAGPAHSRGRPTLWLLSLGAALAATRRRRRRPSPSRAR